MGAVWDSRIVERLRSYFRLQALGIQGLSASGSLAAGICTARDRRSHLQGGDTNGLDADVCVHLKGPAFIKTMQARTSRCAFMSIQLRDVRMT